MRDFQSPVRSQDDPLCKRKIWDTELPCGIELNRDKDICKRAIGKPGGFDANGHFTKEGHTHCWYCGTKTR